MVCSGKDATSGIIEAHSFLLSDYMADRAF